MKRRRHRKPNFFGRHKVLSYQNVTGGNGYFNNVTPALCAPGQNAYTASDFSNFQTPNDWKLPRSVLRAPQVVFFFYGSYYYGDYKLLGGMPLFFATTEYDEFYWEDYLLPGGGIAPFDQGFSHYPHGQWLCDGYTNNLGSYNYDIEHISGDGTIDRLSGQGNVPIRDPIIRHNVQDDIDRHMSDVVIEVRNRINFLRFNQTWFMPVSTTGDWSTNRPEDFLICPVADYDPYVLTDFLIIHIGFPGVSPLDDTYADQRARFVQCYDHFPSFGCYMYSISPPEVASYTQEEIAYSQNADNFLNAFWQHVFPKQTSVAPINDLIDCYRIDPISLASYNAWKTVGLAKNITQINAANQAIADLPGNLATVADDMREYNFAYMGDGTNITADQIVALIADWYGFNPSTGKNL